MLVEGFGGGLPAEDLARSGVERRGDGFEVRGGPARQVGAFGEVLAQQAVGVLVRAALPGAVRVGEEDRDAGLDLELRRARRAPCRGPRSAIGASCSGSVVIVVASAFFIAIAP